MVPLLQPSKVNPSRPNPFASARFILAPASALVAAGAEPEVDPFVL